MCETPCPVYFDEARVCEKQVKSAKTPSGKSMFKTLLYFRNEKGVDIIYRLC